MKKLLLLLAAAALAAPAAASAAPAPRRSVTVDGKAVALVGRLVVRADLTAAGGAKPVRVVARVGAIRFVDLGGDLQVTCAGRGKAASRTDDQGRTVYGCAGAGGRAEVSGSHFQIRGIALRYGLQIPDGYTGTVEGPVRERQPGQEKPAASSSTASSIDADLAAALAQG